jgi:D-alanyl-D-alanine carboxypeptidase
MLTDVGGHELIMVLLDADSNGARMNDAQRMRRWVVAELGVPDTAVAAARPEAAPPKKHAARKQARRKTAVAQKTPTKKSSGKTAVAAGKQEDRKGRVRQSFAAAPGGSSS